MPESFGMHSAAAIADLNGDGKLEVAVGNFGGGLQLFNAVIPVNNLGVSEEVEDAEICVFPNPVHSVLHVISSGTSFRVLDLFGRLVMEGDLTGLETAIDVSDLAPGVYLLSLTLDRGLVNRIFLKR